MIQYLLIVDYEGEMEYAIFSSQAAALADAAEVIAEAPYFDAKDPTLKEEHTYDGVHWVWEETPMRVEVRPITVDKAIGA